MQCIYDGCVYLTAVQPLDLDNLFLFNDGTYTGLQAYKNSKLANVLFAYELSRQLDGTGIKVTVVDPGMRIYCYVCNTKNILTDIM